MLGQRKLQQLQHLDRKLNTRRKSEILALRAGVGQPSPLHDNEHTRNPRYLSIVPENHHLKGTKRTLQQRKLQQLQHLDRKLNTRHKSEILALRAGVHSPPPLLHDNKHPRVECLSY
ncbi:hypothetical protein CEXT_799191 [Caerostris extrusa]|uniref:Uncharacterized protein n=1 Tax=Caerostris extrusa TaxID=172846 RepID=A0AAV4WB09_CAEEX|nr:hypothetical protein CEXT_799191 [Caerostris extrusa]